VGGENWDELMIQHFCSLSNLDPHGIPPSSKRAERERFPGSFRSRMSTSPVAKYLILDGKKKIVAKERGQVITENPAASSSLQKS